jgi:acyl-CoA synthetase (AMP-forming)/AMP-acid ligase II
MSANLLSAVPLALAAPAAAAGLAYFSARTSIDHDYRVLGNAFKATYVTNKNQKRDRLSYFYVLEDHALGKQADSTFLIYEGRKWSYKEAYDMSLKYGTWLKTKYGIKSKDIVAMDFTNSDVFLFLWFGLWAIGARPAFINYNLNGKALSHSILVSTARLVLIEPSIQDNFTQEVRDELSNTTLETFSPELAAEVASTVPIREPDSARSEDQAQNLAILIYTSGTTGLPKPAIVSWKKICVSGLLVSNWMSYSRPDILYTVSRSSF